MAAKQPECGICMDSFNNPTVISCLHSFCYKCLEEYVRENLRNGRFDCPICRTNVELPSEGVSGFERIVYVNTDCSEKKPSLQPVQKDVAEGSNVLDFTPRYVWSSGSSRTGHGFSHRARGMGGRGRTKNQSKYSSHSMQEDIKLHRAKEPWKPKFLAARIDPGKENIRSESGDITFGQQDTGGLGGTTGQTKHISLSLPKDIKLHRAKEPWKPKCLAPKIRLSEEDLRSEELYRKVKSILNKLTPQNFQTLVAKMQALKIDSERCLKDVIDLLFEKAICDPKYSTAYANMSRCLSMFKVPAESKSGDVNFRALLLTRCQREFEKANSLEKEFESKRKLIEKATKEKEKQQMKEELEDEEMKAKRRLLGNIRFLGELFKLKMLTENILHDCVFKLLRTKDEANLECVCILLQTIGKVLDTEKAKPRMNQYFAQMVKLVNEKGKSKKLSNKVRFMLMDVIELRQVQWVSKRGDNNPKTIDQIHREVAQEEQDQAMSVQRLPQSEPQNESPGSSPRQPSSPLGDGADVSNTMSLSSLETDQSINPTKLDNQSDNQ